MEGTNQVVLGTSDQRKVPASLSLFLKSEKIPALLYIGKGHEYRPFHDLRSVPKGGTQALLLYIQHKMSIRRELTVLASGSSRTAPSTSSAVSLTYTHHSCSLANATSKTGLHSGFDRYKSTNPIWLRADYCMQYKWVSWSSLTMGKCWVDRTKRIRKATHQFGSFLLHLFHELLVSCFCIFTSIQLNSNKILQLSLPNFFVKSAYHLKYDIDHSIDRYIYI